MEEMIRVARTLRSDHGFAGYIHLKAIPEASPWLVEQAGLWADRLSINVELPTDSSLARLAPEKRAPTIRAAMGQIGERIDEAKAERRRFAPAGQSTQVIIGADDTTDAAVLGASARLYDEYRLRRVYYSAFSPDPRAEPVAAGQAAAAGARAPALPGRLVGALLRLRCRRDRRGRRRTECSTSRSTLSSPGR